MAPLRITLITGDEPLTVKSVIDLERARPNDLHLVGVVASTKSLDADIPTLLRDMPGMGGVTPTASLGSDHVPDLRAEGKGHEFKYLHVVCDPTALKTVKGYRSMFSARMAQAVLTTDPDVVVLANMMYVLTKQFGHALSPRKRKHLGEITLNIHPSVLPKWRGAHAELKALKAEDAEGLGWTMHSIHDLDQQAMVSLDTGTVVCQQRTPFVTKYDSEVSDALGPLYDAAVEERQRVMTIHAAKLWAARVAHLFAAATPGTSKVVVDEEAFAAEGRLEFSRSDRYRTLLQADHDGWLKKNDKRSEEVPFDQWCDRFRQQYQRLLFAVGGEWRTAEEILGVPPCGESLDLHILTRYDFVLQGERAQTEQTFRGLVALAQRAGADVLAPECRYYPSEGILLCSLSATANLLPELSAMCGKFEVNASPWRIGAPQRLGEGLSITEYRKRLEEVESDLGRS